MERKKEGDDSWLWMVTDMDRVHQRFGIRLEKASLHWHLHTAQWQAKGLLLGVLIAQAVVALAADSLLPSWLGFRCLLGIQIEMAFEKNESGLTVRAFNGSYMLQCFLIILIIIIVTLMSSHNELATTT